MEKYKICECQVVRERIVFDKPKENMKEVTCHVVYVVLDGEKGLHNGIKSPFTKRFPLSLYPSFMFAQVGSTVEYNGYDWYVVLEKDEKKEEMRVI